MADYVDVNGHSCRRRHRDPGAHAGAVPGLRDAQLAIPGTTAQTNVIRTYEEAPTMQTEQHDPKRRNLPSGLSKPAQRALAAAGYTNLEQLTQISEADLGRLHGIGPKAIKQLRQALAENGLSFAARR
jgi:hypothetical protein